MSILWTTKKMVDVLWGVAAGIVINAAIALFCIMGYKDINNTHEK
jgi:hypothetical protein